jgi:hypothetical protein
MLWSIFAVILLNMITLVPDGTKHWICDLNSTPCTGALLFFQQIKDVLKHELTKMMRRYIDAIVILWIEALDGTKAKVTEWNLRRIEL